MDWARRDEEYLKFSDLMHLILEVWRYFKYFIQILQATMSYYLVIFPESSPAPRRAPIEVVVQDPLDSTDVTMGLVSQHLSATTQPGGQFKTLMSSKILGLLNFSLWIKIYIFQCMGKIFCVEFQRYLLQFHTKYLIYTLKDTIFIQHWIFKSSSI